MSWSKWAGVERIDADTYLARSLDEDAFHVVRQAERIAAHDRRDELGRCHECGHWRSAYCNVDGFSYCDAHYPEGLR